MENINCCRASLGGARQDEVPLPGRRGAARQDEVPLPGRRGVARQDEVFPGAGQPQPLLPEVVRAGAGPLAQHLMVCGSAGHPSHPPSEGLKKC